ncbi:uncharacterized protein EDB91DRAFT_870917 [Suillus paluster]|uniref:uncharacterized protein n=1 Tax=Suillus paluster TaxID=48578 RepID=UPI001B88124D|nr:uncharacterized protein EDB91DRAFT_870917 [Suillus paluster]KAG1748266.1 hypothetical protein EDB91DRAFT_870917 [Suillus paluster]
MRFPFLAVVAALTASLSVSATPPDFSPPCGLTDAKCSGPEDCCSFQCVRDGKGYLPLAIVSTPKIPRGWHVVLQIDAS